MLGFVEVTVIKLATERYYAVGVEDGLLKRYICMIH